MIRTAIALLGVAAILAYLGLRQWEIRERAADEPARLTLRELQERGPGENAHVSLSGFDFCDRFGYAEKRVGSGWSAAFFPIVPAGERSGPGLQQETVRVDAANAEEAKRTGVGLSGGVGRLHGGAPLPAKITTVIVSRRLHSASDVGRFAEQRSVQGLVVAPTETLNRYERGELQARFPSIGLSNYVLLEEGRTPPGVWLMAVLFAGGGAALAFAGGLCLLAWRRQKPTAPHGAPAAPAEELDQWMNRVRKDPGSGSS